MSGRRNELRSSARSRAFAADGLGVSLAALAFLLLVRVAPAHAAEADGNALNEADAVARALARTALGDLIAGNVQVETGRARDARAYPNPEIGYAREQTFGTYGSFDDYLTVRQDIDLAGRLTLLGQAGDLRADVARLEGERLRVEVAAETRARYYAVLAAQTRLAAVDVWAADVGGLLANVIKRERRGDSPVYDRKRLERELVVIAAQRASEAATLAGARARLGALIGPFEGAVSGELVPADPPPPLEALQERAAQRPDLAALDVLGRAADRERRAASRGTWPVLRLEAGWKGSDVGPGRADGYVLGAALTLPVWSTSRGQVEAAEGEARAARARREMLLTELTGELAGARSEAEALLAAARDLAAKRQANATDLVRIAASGYAAGELGVLELLDAHRGVAEDLFTLIDVQAAARRARLDLDRLTGAALP